MAFVLLVLAAYQAIAAGAPPRLFLLQTSQAQQLRAFGHSLSTLEAAGEEWNTTSTAVAGPAAFALAAVTPYIREGDEALAAAELAFLAWTSDVSKTKGRLGVFACGVFLGALLCGVVPLLIQACARSIGKAIEAGIEKSDSIIGLEAKIGKVSVHLCEGYVAVHGLTVLNPKGYGSDYLVRVKKVSMDLHMSTLICSSFKEVLVERAVLRGVDVWYNKAPRSSNINDVLGISACDPPGDRALFGGKPAVAGEQKPGVAGGDAEGGGRSGVKVTLREVRVEEVGMRMEHQMFQGSGLRTEMGDISYADFASETEMENGNAHAVALKLLQGVLRSITKTAGSAQRSKRQGT